MSVKKPQYLAGFDTYTEGSILTTMAGAVRNDILTTLANTDNEIAPLQVNSSGALYVTQSASKESGMSVESLTNQTTTNLAGTTLNETLSDSNTTAITLTDASSFPSSGVIKIDSEFISYTSKTSNDLDGTITRGLYGSTAASHSSGATVGEVYLGTYEQNNHSDVMTSVKSSNAGTLYYDFSNDGTLLDSFPVAGFTLTANIHEFHTAVKGKRYFRVRVSNEGSSDTTSFRVYTYYGSFRQGNLPLNSSITDDADSTVVRSVQTGKDPTDSYVNIRADGYIISTNSTLTSGAQYQSSILDVNGYSQVQTELYSDVSGTLVGTWYDDSSGTNTVRTFTFPYTSLALETFSAPTFTRYLRYTYTNGSTSQSAFLLNLKMLTNSISGQILGVESTIVPNMVANLQRSVTVGKQPDGDYVNTPADGSVLSTSSSLTTTQLNGAITASSTTITVDSTTGFASTGTILIKDELITYTGTTGTTFTGCTRGSYSTTAVIHNDNEYVGECYTSNWTDTDGWNSIELFVASDQPSAEGGIIIQYTDSVQDETPTVRAQLTYTYSSIDVETGHKVFRFNPVLDGFRVIYGNGNTTQGSFYLDVTLKVNSSNFRYNTGGGLLSSDFLGEVALGLVSNYETDTKFGRNPQVDTNTQPEDIWSNGGTYTGQPYPPVTETVTAVSSSTSDNGTSTTSITGPITFSASAGSSTVTVSHAAGTITNGQWVTFASAATLGGNITATLLNKAHKIFGTASNSFKILAMNSTGIPVNANSSDTGNGGGSTTGTYITNNGAHTIRIYGLKAYTSETYETEDLTLNGTTLVTSTNTWYRVNRIIVLKSGSNAANVGIISIAHSTTTANIFGTVQVGNNQSVIAAYTVPYGKKMLIKKVNISISRSSGAAGSAEISLRARIPGESYRAMRYYDIQTGGQYGEVNSGGILLDSNTDIKFRTDSVSDNATKTNASMEYVLIDKSNS